MECNNVFSFDFAPIDGITFIRRSIGKLNKRKIEWNYKQIAFNLTRNVWLIFEFILLPIDSAPNGITLVPNQSEKRNYNYNLVSL